MISTLCFLDSHSAIYHDMYHKLGGLHTHSPSPPSPHRLARSQRSLCGLTCSAIQNGQFERRIVTTQINIALHSLDSFICQQPSLPLGLVPLSRHLYDRSGNVMAMDEVDRAQALQRLLVGCDTANESSGRATMAPKTRKVEHRC